MLNKKIKKIHNAEHCEFFYRKGAIELSLNFIVILVISIIIFGFGVRFISKLSSQATELGDLTISNLDEKIGNLICEGSERVCVGIDHKIIKREEFDVFGVKILNVLTPSDGRDGQEFDVEISASNPLGFKKDKTPITTTPSFNGLLFNPQKRENVFIKKNEEKNIGIGIQVPTNAVSGTYIFNVKIRTLMNGQPNQLYVPIQKLYVDVP